MRHTNRDLRNRTRKQKIRKTLAREAKQAKKAQKAAARPRPQGRGRQRGTEIPKYLQLQPGTGKPVVTPPSAVDVSHRPNSGNFDSTPP